MGVTSANARRDAIIDELKETGKACVRTYESTDPKYRHGGVAGGVCWLTWRTGECIHLTCKPGAQ